MRPGLHAQDSIEPIVREREAATKAKKAREPEDRRTQRGSASMAPYYRLMKISCPVCHAKPDAECALPAGSHQARLDILTSHRSSGRSSAAPPESAGPHCFIEWCADDRAGR
ncbi:hypothetical protein ACFY3M_52615 [Streptomyces mirabilis]|uniref:hypothetical protein n=1 Tax=Streptomyces mirabilis TaxID=68239 RepID=UPI0036A8F713